MDLKNLQALGAFVPTKLFKREVPIKRPEAKPQNQWADPEVPEFTGNVSDDTVTVWIRKRSSADFMEIRQAPNRDKFHLAVQMCICHEDGTPVFETLDHAKKLAEWLFVPLAAEVHELHGEGPKNSQPRTNGGASLRSASAAGRSKSGKRRSLKRSSSATGAPTRPSAAP